MEMLVSGEYGVDDRLPSEDEMCERFGVSRATIREAYRALIDAGYLSRRHGSGTFIARVPQRHALDLNLSYTAMIQAAGFTPSIRVISQETRAATDDERLRLRLQTDDDVTIVERIRLADERPVVYSIDTVPTALVPPALRETALHSLFDMLEDVRHGARNGRAQLKPVLAGERESGHLLVEVGAPLLFFDEVDYDEAGMPVLASLEWHTSDVFELWLNRKAHGH
jgi:GntR family transcriptional regulator